jgi:hypothetical protein
MRRLLTGLLVCGVMILGGCPTEEEVVEPKIDPCKSFMDFEAPAGSWMWARGSSANPEPDTNYRLSFQREGETLKAYYVHDLERFELTGTQRPEDWLFESGPLDVSGAAEGETVKKEVHAYLSMDKVCHVYWTVGYTSVTDGVEEIKEEARRVQAPVGQQTVFSYEPCTTELVAGKGAGSFKSAQAMMNPAEPPLLTGDNATFVAWTDMPEGDCQYSFDYFWDGLRKEDALSTVKKSGDKLKWSHRGAISFIGTHEVTLELYQSCDGAAQERMAVACGTFSIM